ncbi:hypothetical protein Ahy_A05g025173 [Arachis hypogaea]|uniref:Uncharacterized protein n=1 Tax=Arachis hypogaea TaxID=3818 RepID=A0A445D7Q1_ARAHY|nr:hypothetical protein Ahy_A05g025173 [Arachis hypogaea]
MIPYQTGPGDLSYGPVLISSFPLVSFFSGQPRATSGPGQHVPKIFELKLDLRVGPDLIYDDGHRWGHMTADLVECINGILKRARDLSVTVLVKAIFCRLNVLYTRKRAEVEACITAAHLFSEYACEKIQSNQRAENNVFEMCEMPIGLEFSATRKPITWHVNQGPRLLPNFCLKRVTKCRPKKTHLLNEIDIHDLRDPRHY